MGFLVIDDDLLIQGTNDIGIHSSKLTATRMVICRVLYILCSYTINRRSSSSIAPTCEAGKSRKPYITKSLRMNQNTTQKRTSSYR
jgi:hypothetical protein